MEFHKLIFQAYTGLLLGRENSEIKSAILNMIIGQINECLSSEF